MKIELPVSAVNSILQPRTVLLLGTQLDGQANVMALSWYSLVSWGRPLLACVVRDESRSSAALMANGECVLSVPPASMTDRVLACGMLSGWSADKRQLCGESVPARHVSVPLLKECGINIECRVIARRQEVGCHLFLLDLLQLWCNPDLGLVGQYAHEPAHVLRVGNQMLDSSSLLAASMLDVLARIPMPAGLRVDGGMPSPMELAEQHRMAVHQ